MTSADESFYLSVDMFRGKLQIRDFESLEQVEPKVDTCRHCVVSFALSAFVIGANSSWEYKKYNCECNTCIYSSFSNFGLMHQLFKTDFETGGMCYLNWYKDTCIKNTKKMQVADKCSLYSYL